MPFCTIMLAKDEHKISRILGQELYLYLQHSPTNRRENVIQKNMYFTNIVLFEKPVLIVITCIG